MSSRHKESIYYARQSRPFFGFAFLTLESERQTRGDSSPRKTVAPFLNNRQRLQLMYRTVSKKRHPLLEIINQEKIKGEIFVFKMISAKKTNIVRSIDFKSAPDAYYP